MKIAFLIPNLGSGGAERVASILCSYWAQSGHQIDLITWEQRNAPSHYPLHSDIKLHQLELDSPSNSIFAFIKKNISRISRLRRVVRNVEPDLVISFLTEANVVCALACKSLNIPSLIAERIHPDAPIISKVHRVLRRLSYPLATHICVQTKEISDWYEEHLGITTTVIPNPIELKNYLSSSTLNKKNKKLGGSS